MLTRPVQRLDQRGRHTEDAADRYAPIVEEALAPIIAEGLPEGVELPGACAGFIVGMSERARLVREEAVEADVDLASLRGRLRQERALRDVAIQALYDFTVDFRWRVKKLVGARGERRHFGVEGITPRDALVLDRWTGFTAELLRDLETREAGSCKREGEIRLLRAALRPSESAEEIEKLRRAMNASLDLVGQWEQKEKDAVLRRQRAIADWKKKHRASARITEEMLGLAGRADLALEVRPWIGRPGRPRKTAAPTQNEPDSAQVPTKTASESLQTDESRFSPALRSLRKRCARFLPALRSLRTRGSSFLPALRSLRTRASRFSSPPGSLRVRGAGFLPPATRPDRRPGRVEPPESVSRRRLA